MQLKEMVQSLQNRLMTLIGKKETLEEIKANTIIERDTAKVESQTSKLAMELLEIVGDVGREHVKEKVETLITQALQNAIYDKDLQFIVNFVKRRGQAECDLLVQHDNDKTRRYVPKNDGGGVTDIVATTLRFMLIMLLKHEGVIALDEPGKWVSPEYRSTFLTFIKEFSEKTGRQIILTTQVHEYKDRECNLTRVYLESGKRSVLQSFLVEKVNNEG